MTYQSYLMSYGAGTKCRAPDSGPPECASTSLSVSGARLSASSPGPAHRDHNHDTRRTHRVPGSVCLPCVLLNPDNFTRLAQLSLHIMDEPAAVQGGSATSLGFCNQCRFQGSWFTALCSVSLQGLGLHSPHSCGRHRARCFPTINKSRLSVNSLCINFVGLSKQSTTH